jgi:hypothetical protein
MPDELPDHIRKLAHTAVTLPRSPDPESPYGKATAALYEACTKAGLDIQKVYRAVLDGMRSTP